MSLPIHQSSRRGFIGHVAGMGAVAALGMPELSAAEEWNLSWLERVRKARHKALFDAPQPGVVLDLATRYYDNLEKVYGKSANGACAVLNLRTRSVSMGIADPIWQKYALGEDAKVIDPTTNASSRRNLDWQIPADRAALGYGSIERLQQLGAIVLICDFALGHLANRLATKAGTAKDLVHLELRSSLLPGVILVPSGIFGAAEAQNAGCAFIPA